MSVPVFPSLVGVTYPAKRTPTWKTIKQEAVSGKESRLPLWSFPRWKWELAYDLLRSDVNVEWQTLVGFFNAVQGAALPFYFQDPDDGSVVGQLIGVGDGSTAAFQLLRSLGGYTEPVQSPVAGFQLFRSDWAGTQLLYPTPRTNLVAYSRQFDQTSAWSRILDGIGGALTITPNATAAPDGSNTAYQLQFSTAGVAQQQYYSMMAQAVTIPAGASASLWLKSATGTNQTMCLENPSNSANGQNYPAFTVTPAWQRFTFVNNNSTSVFRFGLRGSVSGTVASCNVYAWNTQVEANPVATSDIVTCASAATVTDYGVNATGLVTLAAAPASGAVLTWTGSYYWLCRFDDDTTEFDKFASKFWSLKKITFTSVKQ